MSQRRRWFAVLGLGAGALATHPGALPGAQQGVTGAWRLAEVGGRPLPVVVEEGGGCREELRAATLTLEPGGRWTLSAVEAEACDGRPAREERDEERGAYTLQGASVTFTAPSDAAPSTGAAKEAEDDDGNDLDVDDLVSGTVAGGALTVRLDDGTTAVFRR